MTAGDGRPSTTLRARLRRLLPGPAYRAARRLRDRWTAPPAAFLAVAPGWRGGFDPVIPMIGSAALVRGFVAHDQEAVARVDVFLGDQPLGVARTGLPRPDIGSRYPDAAWAPVSGFQLEVDLQALPETNGEARLRARASLLSGAVLELIHRDRVLVPVPRAAQPAVALRALPPVRKPTPAEPARAVVFTHGLGIGGAQLFLHDVLLRLVERRGMVLSVVAAGGGELQAKLEERGVTVRITGAPPVADATAYRRHLADLGAWAWEQRPDLVLVNTLGAFRGIDVADALGRPSLWTIHESFPPNVFWAIAHADRVDPWVRGRGEWALRHASRVVFANRGTRGLFAAATAADRTAVIPNGIDRRRWGTAPSVDQRARARAALGYAPADVVLACVGTIEPRKGQVRVTQAFDVLARRHQRLQLLLVGDRPGEYSSALHQALERASTPRVRVLPSRPSLESVYHAADLVILASDVESLPMVLLEAMSQAACVAASAVFGIPELVSDGEDGLLFAPNDVGAIVAVVERFLAQAPGQRSAMGAAAAARVREHHDLDAYVDRYLELVDGL